MKPQLSYLTTLLLVLVLIACSPEENTSVPPEDTNELIFNGESYPLATAIISEENSTSNDTSSIGIRLFNKTSSEITANGDLDAITFVYFNFNTETIQNTTYNNIEDYDISINGTIINSEFNPGTILLSNADPESDVFAQSGSVTVTNFTPYNIVFTFTFTRNDSQVITGRYDGNYLVP